MLFEKGKEISKKEFVKDKHWSWIKQKNLVHLANYIQRMQDEINARHGGMVPFTTANTVGSFQPPPNVLENRCLIDYAVEL